LLSAWVEVSDAGLGCQGGFDEAVVVAIACDLDGLGWRDHPGSQGQELDVLVASPIAACGLG
jgi:hypothetical protein